ncbi:MAG TPA: NADPH-dependent glutamate synthase, partial [Acidimicrobiia bacterium]|nr:NADPH-dependent glutamate synthase [Acidimicrobiia bacterium]
MSTVARKERLAWPRTEMPEREAMERAHSFDEVNLGFTSQMAVLEAQRCLLCPRPKCIDGCPVGIRIDQFIQQVAAGDFGAAARTIAIDSSLPAVCGRVCPQEIQCEGACVLVKKGRPIAIGHLERFVADFARDHSIAPGDQIRESTGQRVAIVGSGPAGLACAFDLARQGHGVTVFEALHEVGGVLVYGIPEYRLPREVVSAEIDRLRSMGVEFVTNAPIGLAETLDDLLAEYQAVFVGVGAGLPSFLGVPGEHLVGVYSANEFLTRVNLMRAYRAESDTPVHDLAGRRVAVIGGGNTAMDAVRTALRLGAARAFIVYRRTEAEMPARHEEIRHAREEGVDFEFLTSPLGFLGDENGHLRGMRVVKMALGPPDEDGRARPVPVEGSEKEMALDVAIVAAGNGPNPLLRKSSPDLLHGVRGTVVADPSTGRTSKKGVFAGG